MAEDSNTYEREAITNWLEKYGTSPITRKLMTVDKLRTNTIVKRLVDEFESGLQKQMYRFILGIDVKKGDRLFVAFGKSVHKAQWINRANEPKIILMTISGARAQKEASFFVELTKHPHIVRTYGLVDYPDDKRNEGVMLLQEYGVMGDLLEFLSTLENVSKEAVLCEMFMQIADAMTFLAYNRIVHGDLACRNVLLYHFDPNEPKNNVVKVTDFGLSRGSTVYLSVSSSATTTLNIIPYRYAAPEILVDVTSKEAYTEKSDMYSMGVLMWEAFMKDTIPWSFVHNDAEVQQRVIDGERLKQPETCSQKLWDIILSAMAQQPSYRPTFSSLKRRLTEHQVRSEMLQEICYFEGTTLLSGAQQQILNKFYGVNDQKWKLIYKSTTDGDKILDFHRCCDGKSNVLMTILSDNGYLFGGYNKFDWDSSNSHDIAYPDCDNFLFSLTNPHDIQPSKYAYIGGCDGHPVIHCKLFGPCFGYSDIRIDSIDSRHVNTIGFPHAYADTSEKGPDTFTGSPKFKIADIEIFQIVSKRLAKIKDTVT